MYVTSFQRIATIGKKSSKFHLYDELSLIQNMFSGLVLQEKQEQNEEKTFPNRGLFPMDSSIYDFITYSERTTDLSTGRNSK